MHDKIKNAIVKTSLRYTKQTARGDRENELIKVCKYILSEEENVCVRMARLLKIHLVEDTVNKQHITV